MKLKVCPCCRGAKQILGMGLITMDQCRNCIGIGYVADVEELEIDAILQESSVTSQEEAVAAQVKEVKKPIIETRKTNDGEITSRKTDKGSTAKKRNPTKEKTS